MKNTSKEIVPCHRDFVCTSVTQMPNLTQVTETKTGVLGFAVVFPCHQDESETKSCQPPRVVSDLLAQELCSCL